MKYLRDGKESEKHGGKGSTSASRYTKFEYELELNRELLKDIFHNSSDIIIREFIFSSKYKIKAFACYIDQLVDDEMLSEHVLKALMVDLVGELVDDLSMNNVIDKAKKRIISLGKVREEKSVDTVLAGILSGNAALFFDGHDSVLLVDLHHRETRSITPPETEASVRGPRQAFIENIKTNISLLRVIIKNTDLVFEKLLLGNQAKTLVYIAYMEGTADRQVIEELRKRLNSIDTALILDSSYVEQLIAESKKTPFPTIGYTERSDTVAAKIMEGKIAIFCDGSPFVLTVPYLFIEAFHTTDDYYAPPFFASFNRFIRIASFWITLLIPPLYVAIATFHQEMLPTVLLVTAVASREGIPFPTFLEAVIMIFVFEILREAGIRMPRPAGQTISIVGALVIGQAAVQAGIVSAPMVIIVSIMGITALMRYNLKNVTVYFRSFFLVASGMFGFYGLEAGLLVLLIHMCSIKSFGIPYLSPISPVSWNRLIDTFIRLPLSFLTLKPKSAVPKH